MSLLVPIPTLRCAMLALAALGACVPSQPPCATPQSTCDAAFPDDAGDAGDAAGIVEDAGAEVDSGSGDGGSASLSDEGGVIGQSGDQGGADAGCAACPTEAPYCDDGSCVTCIQDAQCGRGVCIQRVCEDCRSDGDCEQPDAARCSEQACVACETSAHCAHLDATPLCDQGLCVECIGDDSSACGNAPTGAPYVCDVLTRTCSKSQTRRSAGLCEPCIADEQCGAGQLCVVQRFDEAHDTPDQGERDVGYYCFHREDYEAPSAPNGTCANVVPFVDTQAARTSIAGVEATICGLAVTTCPAYTRFSAEPCAGLDDDASCGDPRFDDSFCREAMTSTFRCTTPCGSDDDCDVGSSCNSTLPSFCSL